PNGIETIGSYAFQNCSGLRLINLNNELKTIDYGAFADCHGLVSLIINDKLETISDYAFGNCSNLTAVTIPKSVKTMGESSFYDCLRLTVYCYSGSTAHMTSEKSGYKFFLLDEHEHKYATTIETSPTCTRGGSQIRTCTICGYNYIEVLEPIGHGESVWKTTKEANCTEEGIKGKYCTVCNELLGVEYISATGHNYEDKIVEATCTQEGYASHTCKKCGNTYTDNHVDKLPHSYGSWIIDKPATLYNEGAKHRICSVCGYTENAVIDKLGSEDVDTELGTVHFEVVDSTTQTPIEKANIYIYASETEKYTLTTDNNGKLTQLLPVGKNKISVYKDGYQIRNLTINVTKGEQTLDKIGISTQPLVKGELKSRVMTYDEIVDAGINVNATGNQHVYKYEVKMDFGAEVDVLSLITYFMGDGTFVGSLGQNGESHILNQYSSDGGGGSSDEEIYYHSPSYVPGAGGGGGYGFPLTLSNGDEVTVYPVSEKFYLIIRGEVRWLKEMFDVELLVFNNSTTDSISDCEATLTLPEGLYLAEMIEGEQSLTQTIGDIETATPGKEAPSKAVHWYVRGDKEGTYDISAAVSGKMMPFEDEFNYNYTAKDPIKVYAGSALNMDITMPDSAFYGEDYPVTIELTNVSDRTIYGLSHKITDVIQGHIVHYSDGSVKEEVYKHDKDVAYISAHEFKPGDKMVIEITSNIMFQSKVIQYQLEKLCGVVDDVEKLMNMIDAVKKASDLIQGTYNFIKGANGAIDSVLKKNQFSSIEQKKATNELLSQTAKLLAKCEKGDSNTITEIESKLKGSKSYKELMKITENPDLLAAASTSEIMSILSSVNAIINSTPDSGEEFNIYSSIKKAIEAIPIRFVLKDVSVTTLDGSTTEIPYSIHRTKTGAQYFGVDDVGRYLYDLIMAAVGEVDVPWYCEILGLSDPTFSKVSEERIKLVEEQTSKFAAKTATGETKVKAWIEYASTLNATEGTSDGYFELSTDAKDAVNENGVLTFTGDAFIDVKPLGIHSGTLYVEMDGEVVKTYELDVVENHVCASDTWITGMNPSENESGFKVKKCDICDDIIDIEITSACTEHSYSEYKVDLEATEDADRVMSRTCINCGHIDYAVEEVLPEISGIDIKGYTGVYDGSEHTASVVVPEGAVVKYGTAQDEYSLAEIPKYSNVGVYTVYYEVSLEGHKRKTGSFEVKIEPKELTAEMVADIPPMTLTGTQITPKVAVVDGEPSIISTQDYDVSYGVNITVDDGGSVVITGKNNYTGTVEKTFKITRAQSETTAADMSGTYGDIITLTANVVMAEKEEEAALASADVNMVEFKLGEVSLGAAEVVYEDELNTRGTAMLNVTLDKRFAVGNNTVTAEYGGGKNLLDSMDSKIIVEMHKKPIEYTATGSDKVYDGKASVLTTLSATNLIPNDTVTLTAPAELSAINVGEYTEATLGTIALNGVDIKYYSIEQPTKPVALTAPIQVIPKPVSNTEPNGIVITDIADIEFTGEEITPSINLTDSKIPGGAVDYSTAYSNNIEAGTATATMTFEGNYAGVMTKTFVITRAQSETTVADVSGTYGDIITLTANVVITEKEDEATLASANVNTVEFMLGEVSLGVADVVYEDELNSRGTATLEITLDKRFAVGNNAVTAEYGGGKNLLDSMDSEIIVNMVRKKLEYTVSADSKDYDGTAETVVSITPINLIDGDEVSIMTTGLLASSEVGSYSEVSLYNTATEGADAEYYEWLVPQEPVELSNVIEIRDVCKLLYENGQCTVLSGSPITGVLILAVYDSNGALDSVTYENLVNVQKHTFKTETDGSMTTKIMLWDNFNNMIPLTQSISF
ncbi:MAG: leucine-rich repeat protein, partial [bacterium]|nr:leucine-rich repeat protein [bacterium]